jgi:hypothetical protein
VIKAFVERFDDARDKLRELFSADHPGGYDQIVRTVVEALYHEDDCNSPDPERITVIDHGDYQGTRLFIIGARGYQPSTYWAVVVDYGSCSGCDTYEAINGYSREKPTTEQAEQYLTLALHVVQRMRQIAGYGLAEAEGDGG